MEDIVYIVKRLKICKGLIVNNKKTILINITVEVLQEVLQNNKESKRTYKSMRCRTCLEVLNWLSTGNACIRCRKLLNSFKNPDQSKLINLEDSTDKDLSMILDNLFPGATPEMKMFLSCQRELLMANGAKQRRWDKT